VRRSRGRALVGLCLAGLSTVAACGGGGGGQLAERDHDTRATRAAPNAPVPERELAIPRTAAAVTRSLRDVETGLRGGDRDAAHLAALGRRQDLAYRALVANPSWIDSVDQAVPASVHAAVSANVEAGTALAELTSGGGAPPTSFPDWQVLAPLPAATLRAYYEEGEAATGTPWQYLAAIHLVESRLGRIHGTSTAGAQGPMQFIPATWETYGAGDISDDHDAIKAAARYLADRGAPGDMTRALYSYNNDSRYVVAIEAYARVLREDPRAYDGYHAWQVFVATDRGTFLLPEGYGTP
jgi:soluble lytic murein transglycosylase-like protein